VFTENRNTARFIASLIVEILTSASTSEDLCFAQTSPQKMDKTCLDMAYILWI
jgi:hypothetical protein